MCQYLTRPIIPQSYLIRPNTLCSPTTQEGSLRESKATSCCLQIWVPVQTQCSTPTLSWCLFSLWSTTMEHSQTTSITQHVSWPTCLIHCPSAPPLWTTLKPTWWTMLPYLTTALAHTRSPCCSRVWPIWLSCKAFTMTSLMSTWRTMSQTTTTKLGRWLISFSLQNLQIPLRSRDSLTQPKIQTQFSQLPLLSSDKRKKNRGKRSITTLPTL